MGPAQHKSAIPRDPHGRVVVVSPHLDDAVMSLGATMARAIQAGATTIEVLTVFGYEPSSTAPAGPWDLQSGFDSEGQAARRRRAEDDEACSILGITPRWLSFGAEPYERHGSEDEIWSAVTAATEGADCVLIPGYPLVHPDHAELSQLILRRGLGQSRVGLYAEQPYSFQQRETPRGAIIAPPLESLCDGSLEWGTHPSRPAERRLKFKAVQAYQSQLRSLGLRQFGYLRLHWMLWHEARQGGESIAWLS